MFLDKALKKQKKFKKLFFITMGILGLFLPVLTYLANIKTMFVLAYLIILEVLIILAIFSKLNFYNLDFFCSNNRLRIKSGILSKSSLIFCNKVAIIHTNKSNEEVEIIIVTTINIKNKTLKPITKAFLQKFPEVSEEYLRLKRLNPEKIYYFQIVRRGALDKYILLDNIYRNCVNAVYTASAIENIKIARMQIELK